MGLIVKPNTFVNGNTVIGAQWNANFAIFFTEFNGLIDNANFKAGANINGSKFRPWSIANAKLATPSILNGSLNYQSVLLDQFPAAGYRSTQGIEAFTYVAGVATGTITFATESNIQTPAALDPTPFDTGNPSFAAAPRVTLAILHTTGTNQHHVKITAITNLSFDYEVRSSSGADISSGSLLWRAIGLD